MTEKNNMSTDKTKDNNDYILIYHRGKGQNISTFMERNFIFGITSEDLFEYNREYIFQQMTTLDKKAYAEKYGGWPGTKEVLKKDMILPSPCTLRINSRRVTAELAIAQTNLQTISNDFYAFAHKKIQSIYQDEGFSISEASKSNPEVTVFGWFKSLYYVGLDAAGKSQAKTAMENKDRTELEDLSRHIISLATTVTNNGGSFVIRLPIITANSLSEVTYKEVKEANGKKVYGETTGVRGLSTKLGSLKTYNEKTGEYYSKNSFSDIESNYFNWLMSSNDLLFISFEKLDMELINDNPIYSKKDDDVRNISSMISNGIFDMIGLIDEVKVITSSDSASAYVEVTGRDLMKLIIEDGSFFFNPSVTSDPNSVFLNAATSGRQGDVREADLFGGTYNDPLDRIRRISGEIDVFANRINMDISYILKGVISQLANIEVVPNYVFESWGDDRTKFVELQPIKK